MPNAAPYGLLRTIDGHNPGGKATGAQQYSDFPIDPTKWHGNDEFGTGEADIAVAVTAPNSGKLLVVVGGGARDNSSAERFRLSFEIRTNTRGGAVVLAPDELRGWVTAREAASYMFGSRVIIVENLTPTALYWVRAVFQSSSGSDPDTVDWQYPGILVVPLT